MEVGGATGTDRPARLRSAQKSNGEELELKLVSIEPQVSVVTDCVGNSEDASDAAKSFTVPHAGNRAS